MTSTHSQPPSTVPGLFSGTFPSNERFGLRFCLSAPIGNLFSKPQVLHFRTNTSAHRFLPPLLLFSTLFVHVVPSMSMVSQFLHIECFMAGEIRIRSFLDTERKSEIMCRDTGSRGNFAGEFAVEVVGCTSCDSEVLECCCWVARYAAAW
jgi:hypothetical protein